MALRIWEVRVLYPPEALPGKESIGYLIPDSLPRIFFYVIPWNVLKRKHSQKFFFKHNGQAWRRFVGFFVFWRNTFFLMHWYFWRSVKDSFYNWLSRCSMKIGFFLSEVNIRNCSRRNNSSTQMHLVATENLLRLYRELSCTEKIKLRQERDGFCCSPSFYAHTFHMHTHHHCKGPCSSGLHKDCKTIVYSHFMPFFIICQYLCHIPIARCNGLQVVAATIGLPKRKEN